MAKDFFLQPTNHAGRKVSWVSGSNRTDVQLDDQPKPHFQLEIPAGCSCNVNLKRQGSDLAFTFAADAAGNVKCRSVKRDPEISWSLAARRKSGIGYDLFRLATRSCKKPPQQNRSQRLVVRVA